MCCARIAVDDLAINELANIGIGVPKDARPDYNAPPSRTVGIITADAPSKLQAATFGLIPSWSKDGKTAYSMVNARLETVHEKPAYRHLLASHRCVIPVAAFYEWKTVGKDKEAFAIKTDEPVMFLAGLWTTWQNPETKEIKKSFTILTMEPSKLFADLHDREPAILDTKQYKRWLEEADVSVLKHFPEKRLNIYRVDNKVGNVRSNGPDLLKPLAV